MIRIISLLVNYCWIQKITCLSVLGTWTGVVPGAAKFRRRRRKALGAAAAEFFIPPPLHRLAPPPNFFQRRAEFVFFAPSGNMKKADKKLNKLCKPQCNNPRRIGRQATFLPFTVDARLCVLPSRKPTPVSRQPVNRQSSP